MQIRKYIGGVIGGAALIGCASTLPAFDSDPPAPLSAETLKARAEASAVECNKDPVRPIIYVPPTFILEGLRSGRVSFVFDVSDIGRPQNIRVTEASEAAFVQPATKSVMKWKYVPKGRNEPASKRQNICTTVVFKLVDEQGREIPTWKDIETQNETYQDYKRGL